MPSFTGNPFASFYNRILQINRSGNSNVDATTRTVQSGGGVDSAISLSDDVLQVQPQTDDTTGAFLVKNQGGSTILSVDTTTATGGSNVKCGTSQVNALTHYKEFNVYDFDGTVGGHMIMFPGVAPFGSSANLNEVSLGTGTDPATTLDVSAESVDSYGISPAYWYLPDAITIVAVHILMGGGTSSDSALNFHLMSYDIDTSTNFGDLSNGVVVADSGTTSAVDEDVIKYTTMTNLPTDVAAGKVILATLESDTTQSISVNMIVKYNIQ